MPSTKETRALMGAHTSFAYTDVESVEFPPTDQIIAIDTHQVPFTGRHNFSVSHRLSGIAVFPGRLSRLPIQAATDNLGVGGKVEETCSLNFEHPGYPML